MKRDTIGISIAILEFLKDAEYHTLTSTTNSVIKFFQLTDIEMNEIYESRESNKNSTFSKKKIYTQVQMTVSKLRKEKFVKDFPGTKNKGVFAITNEGSNLLIKEPDERRHILNLKFNKKKNRKSTTN